MQAIGAGDPGGDRRQAGSNGGQPGRVTVGHAVSSFGVPPLLLLRALGERVGVAIDNLDRAERLGLLSSADAWMTVRRLRSQMIHGYIEDPVVLADALRTGHDSVPPLLDAADRMHAEILRRSWL